MDKDKCKLITAVRYLPVKLNPAWPKYQLICGELIRIQSPLEPPERLGDKGWQTITFVAAA